MKKNLDKTNMAEEKFLHLLDECLKNATFKKDVGEVKRLLLLKDIAARLFQEMAVRLKDYIKVSGTWQIKCFEQGQLKWVDSGHNLVVTSGLDHIADQLSDKGENVMSHMAGGDDDTAPAAGQTALLSQLGARVAFDSKTQTGGNTVVYIATFGAGVATGTWEEVGIFNNSGGGEMLDRLLTGTKVKAAAETFKVTITLTISAV